MPINFDKYGTPITATPNASKTDFSKYGTVVGDVEKSVDENAFVGFGKGVGKGTLSTISGLSGLGEKITRAITPKVVEDFLLGEKQEKSIAEQFIPEKYRTPTTGAQKAGFVTEQIAEFFIPAGLTAKAVKGAETAIKATKLAPKAKTALNLLTRSGILGAESAGVTAAQTGGDLKQTLEAGITGAAIPPVVSGAAKVAGKGLKAIAARTPTTRLEEMTRSLRTLQNVFDEGVKKTKVDGKIVESNPIKTFGELKLVPRVVDNRVDATSIIKKLDDEISALAKPRAERIKVSGKSADIADFQAELNNYIQQSKHLRSSGLVSSTIKKAEGIIDDFRQSYGNKLSVEVLDDIRQTMNKRFDPELRDVFRAIGDTARKYVYRLDEASRPTLLREGELIAARDFAEALNNRVVKGGRLGSYVNQVLGAIVGSSLQFPVAGPLIGAFGGKKLDDVIRQSYFKVPGSKTAQRLLNIGEKIKGTSIGRVLFGGAKEKAQKLEKPQLLLPPPRSGAGGSSVNVPINLPRRSASSVEAQEIARASAEVKARPSTPAKGYEQFYKQLAGEPIETTAIDLSDIPFFSKEEEIGMARSQIDQINEVLRDHPAKPLLKYTKYKGSSELPEILGGDVKSTFGKRGDDIIKTAGFEDDQAAQEAVDGYFKLLKEKKDLESFVKGGKEAGFATPKALLALAGAGAVAGTATKKNIIDIKNPPLPVQTEAPKQPTALKLGKFEYIPKQVPKTYSQPILQAYLTHPDLQPGLIEAVLMKESEMGTNKKSDNIGEIKKSAIDELKRNKIPVNLKTAEGTIKAVADYLAIRKKQLKISDPVELYMRGYYGDTSRKKDAEIFRHYYNFYKPRTSPKKEENQYARVAQ